MFLLVLTSFTFAEFELKDFNYFSSDDLERIVTSVEVYEPVINKHSSKFEVPSYILKSLIGIETEGVINRQEIFNDYDEIGLTHLRPFDENGNSIHYDLCIESGCMTEIEDLNQDIETKKKQVESEYLDVHNSICCAAYILKKEYDKGSVDFPSNQNNCPDVTTRTYTEWDSALRRFKGLECDLERGNDYINYIEKINQLIDTFQNTADYSTSSFGILRFTPSFSMSAPTLIDIFGKLPSLIKDLQSVKTKLEVEQKLNNFAAQNNVEFSTYCEKPDVNIVNKIYDNIVNSVLFEETCLYPIADEFSFSGNMQDQTLLFDFDDSSKVLSIKNSIGDDIQREFKINMPDNFFLGFNSIDITQGSDYMLDYATSDFVGLNNQLSEIQNIYFVNNYGDDTSVFVFHQKVEDVDKYYDSLGSEIDINALSLTLCDPSLPNYKLKYFTCLDTKQKEEVYDWVYNKWVESDETVKIKFAFAIPKSNH